jgi:hypothetical protein
LLPRPWSVLSRLKFAANLADLDARAQPEFGEPHLVLDVVASPARQQTAVRTTRARVSALLGMCEDSAPWGRDDNDAFG